jgi:hypothetical protein
VIHTNQRERLGPLEPAPRDELANLAPSAAPVLNVLIDTEEEFDWSAGFHRNANGVTAIRELRLTAEIFERFGVVPTYAITYPVATTPDSIAVIRDLVGSGRGVLGAHLHPWVNPPFEEQLCSRNSFPGNLPRELEANKLAQLGLAIERNFGERTRIYHAGRFGLGPHTPHTLEEQGFEIDFSRMPAYDFSPEEGPDFSRLGALPYWFGERRKLLAVPVTGALVGFAGAGAPALSRLARHPALAWARLTGVLARVGAVDRLRLSPEGFALADLVRLTRWLQARGVRVFTFSFHAPSLKVGCTSYVRTQQQLDEFLDCCRGYLDFFLGELGGRCVTAPELFRLLERESYTSSAT